MKNLQLLSLLLLFLPCFVWGQDSTFSSVNTKAGDVKIPGIWKQLNTMDDSGQTYLKNEEGIIIAIAKNPQKTYPFFNADKSEYENVEAFYKWDSDYRIENHFETKKLKGNPKLEYIIWKYNDGKLDNVFLFGASSKNFLNLLVYTSSWEENEKINFLEKLYEINK